MPINNFLEYFNQELIDVGFVTQEDLNSLRDIFYELVDDGIVDEITVKIVKDIPHTEVFLQRIMRRIGINYSREIGSDERFSKMYEIMKSNLIILDFYKFGYRTDVLYKDISKYILKSSKYLNISLALDLSNLIIMVKNLDKIKEISSGHINERKRIKKFFKESVSNATVDDESSLVDIFYQLVDEGKCSNVESIKYRRTDMSMSGIVLKLGMKNLYFAYSREYGVDWNKVQKYTKIIEDNLIGIKIEFHESPKMDMSDLLSLVNPYVSRSEKYTGLYLVLKFRRNPSDLQSELYLYFIRNREYLQEMIKNQLFTTIKK